MKFHFDNFTFERYRIELTKTLAAPWMQPLRDRPRRLGVSAVSSACLRKAWYAWRWFGLADISARQFLIFERGHLEEARVIALIRACGYRVKWSGEGEAIEATTANGHVVGIADGLMLDVKVNGKFQNWLLEIKTANARRFRAITKAIPPEYINQMQLYMHLLNLPAALFFAVCKDTDEIYHRAVDYDKDKAESLLARAEIILTADKPPPRVADTESYYQCRVCDYREICWYGNGANSNCRTCKHSQLADSGKWDCAKGNDITTLEAQKAGCTNFDGLPIK